MVSGNSTQMTTSRFKLMRSPSPIQSALPLAALSTSTRRSHSVTRSTTEFQTSVLTVTSLITSLISELLRPRSRTNSRSELMLPRPNGTTQPRTLTITSLQSLMVISSPPTRTSPTLRRTSATTGPSPSNLTLMSKSTVSQTQFVLPLVAHNLNTLS